MKIAYVTPGAAGMLCGSCLNDNALASALIALGHDVALVPVYTPIRTDEEDVSIDRVFYGAINVYLEQRSALFRHTPWIVDRLLASPWVLNLAAGRGTSIDARELGDLTLSMLRGEEGRQAKELTRLVAWLRDDFKPDLVHLSNSMLVGMAREIRRALGVPVLCSVQGEDLFLDELEEPYRTSVRATLSERVADADGFIATSRYYAEFMAPYLGLDPGRMHTVPLGIKLDGLGAGGARPADAPFVVGYLARICPEKGLHLLVDAFRRLAEERGAERVRLRIAGWRGPRDQAYFDGIMVQVRTWGLEPSVEYRGEIDRVEKVAFLASLHVLSVPTTYHEPKGRFVLEALASGVPVVQPHHGAFPELIEATGGGLLVPPHSPQALAEALGSLMDDPARRAALGRAGQSAVHREFGAEAMARRTLAVYERYLGGEMTEFTTRRRVEFADTDLGGIMHFSRYFVFMETAEHLFLESIGTSVVLEVDGHSIGWPRVAASCEYRRPARFGETIEIRVQVSRKGETSMTYEFAFLRDGEELALGQMTSVCCVLDTPEGLRPIPIPDAVARRLED